jgi:glycosyltransferase involved in cell wall biosynthesis
LHMKGQLTETISGKLSHPLYYFSPKHTINPERRSWYNTEKARVNGLPYTLIHQHETEKKVFPPYAEAFKNDVFKFEKPILCICNRINLEWDTAAINYFDEEILDWMFANLKDQYEIIYFAVDIPEDIRDQVDPYMLKDKEVAKRHDIKLFTDLLGTHTWNETMLMLFANCKHYITMNGGYSIMASLFPGQNIIYSKPGSTETKELKFKAFWRWYPNHANQQVLHVPSYDALKKKIDALYIRNLPTANVLIRTSKRPNYFSRCIESVLKQDYENVNIVVICDEDTAVKYTRGYNCRMIQPDPVTHMDRPENDPNYTAWFPYNAYLDQAQRKVNGFLFFLDDDDMYNSPKSISSVMQKAKRDSLMIWKVNMKKYGIIPNGSFGKKPTLGDVTGIGLCYHTDNIDKSDWTPFKCADFRTAKNFDKIVWIDSVLSEIQDEPGRGIKKDINLLHQNIAEMKKAQKKLVTFTRDFNNYKKGETVWLPWIEVINLVYRKMVTVVEDDEIHEPVMVIETAPQPEPEPEAVPFVEKQMPQDYETKELKPVKTRKNRKK